jgi:hypothetical protein
MKLVKQIEGKAGQGLKGGDSPLRPESAIVARSRTRGGVVIDGVVCPLQGEPPIAVSHGDTSPASKSSVLVLLHGLPLRRWLPAGS